jgi:outer membrane immunogenic protein
MKRLLIVGAALAALVAGTDYTPPADAAEPGDVRPTRRAAPVRRAAPAARPEAPRSNWTGGQAGGQGGGSNGAQSFVDPPFLCVPGFPCPVTPFSFSGSPSSATGGGFVGYRFQLGGMVVGVESDISAKKLETTQTLHTGPTLIAPGVLRTESFTGSVKQTWDASFRLRTGWLVTPWTLAYITGGLAIGEVKTAIQYNATLTGVLCGLSPCVATVNAAFSDTRVGGTVGAGLEQALGPFLKARVEYRYTDFGKFTKDYSVSSNCLVGVCTAPSTSSLEAKAAFHKVTVGLGFDF